MLKIVVDAMGGDNAPAEIVKGAITALEKRKDFMLVLMGDETPIAKELLKYKYDASRVDIVHCSQVITNDDEPAKSILFKKDSSIVVGLKMLRDDEKTAAFISAGSTGAVLTGAYLIVKNLPGVLRPALCPGIPNVRGTQTLLCDCGANAECKPENLVQFALMASAYAKSAYGIENPRVGLLTNGTEEHKGDTLHQEAHKLLKETKGIHFVGNIEGRDIMYGDVDVAVSDGFSGNIALKAIEGCGKTVSAVLGQEFRRSLGTKLSYLCAKKPIGKLKGMLDYARLGGSAFLGLKKIVIKSHGNSKAKSITACVLQALEAYEGKLVENLAATLAETGFSETAGA